jgi:hypothetical protein
MHLVKRPQINKEYIEIYVYETEILVVRSEILEADIYLNNWDNSTGITVSWDVTPYSLVESH